MNTFFRAAIVSAVVGVLFAGLTAWLGATSLRAGLPGEALVPVILGPALKGLMAVAAAAVFFFAGAAERRREALMATLHAVGRPEAVNENTLSPPLKKVA